MTQDEKFVIIGGGLAGAMGAEWIRTHGFGGSVTLLSNEVDRPYERPPLSKGYLNGSASRESVFVHTESWYRDVGIDLRLGNAARAIDPTKHLVTMDNGEEHPYDKLMIATGSTPRRLDVPGADLANVFYLRKLSDSEQIKQALGKAKFAVIVGAGWIGLETAAAARAAGVEVSLLEAGPLPLVSILGSKIAQVFADVQRDNGVDLRCNTTVASIEGKDGHVTGVVLSDGSILHADVVIVGVGITPEVTLAAAAGLTIEDGIVVDEHLRSSNPDIFAVGDVANAFNPRLGRHIRVEHWANALNMPSVAASGMMGNPQVYDRLPFFYSDQFDLGLEYTGYAARDEADEVVVRGDLAKPEFIAFWLADGRVLAGMNVNVWDVSDDIRALVESKRTVDVAKLADASVALTAL